jgi:hypothetical protein
MQQDKTMSPKIWSMSPTCGAATAKLRIQSPYERTLWVSTTDTNKDKTKNKDPISGASDHNSSSLTPTQIWRWVVWH